MAVTSTRRAAHSRPALSLCGFCGQPLGGRDGSYYHRDGCQRAATDLSRESWDRLNAGVTAAGSIEVRQYTALLRLLDASMRVRFADERGLPAELRIGERDELARRCRLMSCPADLITLATDVAPAPIAAAAAGEG